MTATLLAHSGHIAPSTSSATQIGVVLLLVGAAIALRRDRDRIIRSRTDDDRSLDTRPLP